MSRATILVVQVNARTFFRSSHLSGGSLLCRFGLVKSLACQCFPNRTEHGRILNFFMMSGILGKQADEFCQCVSQKHIFSLILQNRPDEFCDEFQTHRGQRAEVSRECRNTIQSCSLSISRCRGGEPKVPPWFLTPQTQFIGCCEPCQRNRCFWQSLVSSHIRPPSTRHKRTNITANTRTRTNTHEHHHNHQCVNLQKQHD